MTLGLQHAERSQTNWTPGVHGATHGGAGGPSGPRTQDLVAGGAQVTAPCRRPGAAPDHHDQRVQLARGQNVENLGEDEQSRTDVAHRVATSGYMDFLGVHGMPLRLNARSQSESVYYRQ
jgi:hypothetical protein